MKKKYQKLLATFLLMFNLSQDVDLPDDGDLDASPAIVEEMIVDEEERSTNGIRVVFKAIMSFLPALITSIITGISLLMNSPLKYPVLSALALILIFLAGLLLFKDNPMACILGVLGCILCIYTNFTQGLEFNLELIIYLVMIVYFAIYAFISYRRLSKMEVKLVYEENKK